MGAIRSSVFALRRPAILATAFSASIAAAVVSTLGTVLTATANPTNQSGGGPATRTIAELSTFDGWSAGMTGASTLVGAVAFSVVAAVVASDFSTGVIRNVLVRYPSRRRLMLCKVVVAVALAAVAALAASLTALAVALVVAPGNDIDTATWLTSDGIAAATGGTVNLVGAAVGFGALGAVAAVLTRSAGIAIGVGLGWLIAGEALLAALLDGAEQILPGRLLFALASGGTSNTTYLISAASLVVIVVLAIATSTEVFARRDVTG